MSVPGQLYNRTQCDQRGSPEFSARNCSVVSLLDDPSDTLLRLVRSVSTPELEPTCSLPGLVYSPEVSDAIAETYTSAITMVRLRPGTNMNPGLDLFGIPWCKQLQQGDRMCLVRGCSRPLIFLAHKESR